MGTFTVGGTATIDEGEYPATLRSHETGPDGQYGPTERWYFDVYVDGEAETLDTLTGFKYTAKSNLKKLIDALLGRPLADGDDIEAVIEGLIGKTCRVIVGVNESGYSKIEMIKASAKKKAGDAAG